MNKVKLTWSTSETFSARKIVVMRAEKPIINQGMLISANILQELSTDTKEYEDNIQDSGTYYYAVVARTQAGTLYNILIPSVNATVTPVVLSKDFTKQIYKDMQEQKKTEPEPDSISTMTVLPEEKIYSEGQMRELPLPYLDLIDDLYKKPSITNPEVIQAGKELSMEYQNSKKKVLLPYIFEEDLISNPEGDGYYLFKILKTHFITEDYQTSVHELKKFLSIYREPDITRRAAFYLGEAQYYCRRYRQAIAMFLFVEDDLPVLARKWIDSSLDFYKLDK
ncbi:tetratricopeptide repeat protein [Treponema zioleckii]|uniref:tetratricopeptide repeat protein n=1 Tax=Treponema zioleckii TaxID=331680 RepID=UPI00168B9FE4|nr:hypothetical protein [Treponema zioleckii]